MTDPVELNDSPSPGESGGKPNLVGLGLALELGLVILAIGLSYLGFYDHHQKLAEITLAKLRMPAVIGLLGMIPLVFFMVSIDRIHWPMMRSLRAIADDLLYPLFKGLPLWQLLVIAIGAGVGEELLFRWCLQGGIRSLIESQWLGISVSLIVASVVFGICHWLNFTYFIFALLVGIYFGAIMELTDSVVAPMITHALYDFVALVYIVHLRHPEDAAVSLDK